MKKNNFNLDIFLSELSNNILNASTCIEDLIKKANGGNDFIWKDEELDFDPNYKDLEENFSILHNSLKYVKIISIVSEPGKRDYATEYGHLSSNKSDLSFLIVADAYDVNISSYPIKSFKNINKPEFKELKNLIAENYPKSNCQSFENGYIETVYLNDKYKWDKDYLNKLVYKSQKARERVAKHLKENHEKEKNSSTLQKIAAEFNSNITFCRVQNKK